MTDPAEDDWRIRLEESGLDRVEHDGQLLALIVRNDFAAEGIRFFTPSDFSQQLAHMSHPAGKVIEPHTHNPVRREVIHTQEVLFLKRGKLRVDFYGADQKYAESRLLGPGDVILLVSGGHGFEAIEDLEMIEVKQGPFLGDVDKTRFDGIGPEARRTR